jgi:hypothetical protein
LPLAARHVLDLPAGTHFERAASAAVGVGDIGAAFLVEAKGVELFLVETKHAGHFALQRIDIPFLGVELLAGVSIDEVIDDVFGELDLRRRNALLAALPRVPAQGGGAG